jgi:putative endopeptidase
MGKIYVSRFFSEEDKNTVHGMVKDVLAIMRTSLKTNDWLTEETKANAMKKLDKFIVKLGFPDKWKKFDALDILADDGLFAMQQKVNTFEYTTEFLGKINSVKDKTKWEMDPQDVNAYFHPLNNEIVFPAAIMQPPFYQRTFEHIDSSMKPFISSDSPDTTLMAVNFGGIGAVIAHEITHGYDDQGRKFDSDGNINDWWKDEDTKLFKSKCDLMAEQAVKWTFEDVPEDAAADGDEAKKEATVHTMNGDLTMGENLADLGGLSLAYQAMQARFGDRLTKDHTIAFFTSFACIWKQKETKAHTIKALATDPHAPPSFRANLVKNIDAFHSAYETKEGDPMYLAPEKRVRMW